MSVVKVFGKDEWVLKNCSRLLVGDNQSIGDPYLMFTMPSIGKRISLIIGTSSGRLSLYNSTDNQAIATFNNDAYTRHDDAITGLTDHFTVTSANLGKANREAMIFMNLTAKDDIANNAVIATIADGYRPCLPTSLKQRAGNAREFIVNTSGTIQTVYAITKNASFQISGHWITNHY